MKSYLLTPEGAADKLADLYTLSDRTLATHSMAIALDFKSWIKSNFELTPAQETYIEGINNDASHVFGLQCSMCFLHRIHIKLDYPAPPSTSGYSKWTGSESTIKMATDGNGKKQVSGSLKFVIDYTI